MELQASKVVMWSASTNRDFDSAIEFGCQKPVSLLFVNQGTASVSINSQLFLEQGESFRISCDVPYYDNSKFTFEFGAGVKKLVLVAQVV